jgi:phosphoribosylanthranilate isomerase
MSVMVKICGLREMRDVDAAVEAGADAVGFVFAESTRRVSPDVAMAACENLPIKVLRVAVMQHPTDDEWQEVLDGFEPDVLQTDYTDYASLDVPEHVECWPVYRESVELDFSDLPDTYLYEGKKSGAGETVNWQRAAMVATHGRMILAGGLSTQNVGEAISIVRPYGVDVSSAVESTPGTKDPKKIVEFLQAVRAAEKSL